MKFTLSMEAIGTENWKIRLLRSALGLSQPALARLVDTYPSYISAIETGHVDPTTDLRNRLRRALAAYYMGIGGVEKRGLDCADAKTYLTSFEVAWRKLYPDRKLPWED